MIEVRYSSPSEIEVSGTVDELQLVRRAILHLNEATAGHFIIEVDQEANPAPYSSCLSRILIRKIAGPIRVAVTADALVIESSAEHVEALASFFDFPADAVSGEHNHFEYWQGNDWIAADAVPLVISVK